MADSTYKQLQKIMQDAIAEDQRLMSLHDEIADILREKFTGKKITKRLVSEYVKRYPTRTARLDYIAGLCHLEIWGGDICESIQDRERFFIGYTGGLGTCDTEEYNPETFEERDVCYTSGARERIVKLSAILDDTETLSDYANMIDRYKAARDTLQNSQLFESFNNPVHFTICKECGIDEIKYGERGERNGKY